MYLLPGLLATKLEKAGESQRETERMRKGEKKERISKNVTFCDS